MAIQFHGRPTICDGPFHPFEALCGCNNKLLLFPDFPIPGVTHMEIVEAGLQVLENDVITPVNVESIRLMRNKIRSIEEDAFRYYYGVIHGWHSLGTNITFGRSL